MSGGSWRYDARAMATNPHLVPEFEDQPAPPASDAEDDT